MHGKERKKLFRIYDKKHKRYITSPDTACINHYGEMQRAFGFTGEPTLAPDEYAVEFYMGFDDKHNKQIFDGDLMYCIESHRFNLNDPESIELIRRLNMLRRIYNRTDTTDKRFAYVDVIVKTDYATREDAPIYWLKEEQFGYEGEGLELPSRWVVSGLTKHDPFELGYEVKRVEYKHRRSTDRKTGETRECVHVKYHTKNGMQFLCSLHPERDGYPRTKFEEWWRINAKSGQIPYKTVELMDAIESGQIWQPDIIIVGKKPDSPYNDITVVEHKDKPKQEVTVTTKTNYKNPRNVVDHEFVDPRGIEDAGFGGYPDDFDGYSGYDYDC